MVFIISSLGCGQSTLGGDGVKHTPSHLADGWSSGQWVRYEYSMGTGEPAAVTVAVTGDEIMGGVYYFWLEVWYGRGGHRLATRILVPQLDTADFFGATGDLLPGAISIWRRDGVLEPYLVSLAEAEDATGVTLQMIFGGGSGTVLNKKTINVPYKALGGKDLECEESTIMIGDSEEETAFLCDEIPVTGVARVTRGSVTLELIDFGFSGAGTLF
jgi:hypothetical protein